MAEEIIEQNEKRKIVRDKSTGEVTYQLAIKKQSALETKVIKEAISKLALKKPFSSEITTDIIKKFSSEIGEFLIGRLDQIDGEDIPYLVDEVVSEVLGYGRLEELVNDQDVEEILVNGANAPVYVAHKKYGMIRTNVEYGDNEEIMSFINNIAKSVGKSITRAIPFLNTHLPHKRRFGAIIPPASPAGPALSIRKFPEDIISFISLIKNDTLTLDSASFLWMLTDGTMVRPANMLFVGGPGSGKTTTMNAMLSLIPGYNRIISIEDTLELNLKFHPNYLQLEAKKDDSEGLDITMDDLLKQCLRMRADRIIVGEVRGEEALTMFTAMNTGHEGTMATLHAHDTKDAILRLTNPPMSVPVAMVPLANIVIIHKKFHVPGKGSVRKVVEISEITGVERGNPLTSKLFFYNAEENRLERTNIPSAIKESFCAYSGRDSGEFNKEWTRRKNLLEHMCKKGPETIEEVKALVERYYKDPEKVYIELGV